MACWLPYWTTQHIPVIAENSVIQGCRVEVFQFPVLEQKGEGRKRRFGSSWVYPRVFDLKEATCSN